MEENIMEKRDLNNNPLIKGKEYLTVNPLYKDDNGIKLLFDGNHLKDAEGLDYYEYESPYTMYRHEDKLIGVLPIE